MKTVYKIPKNMAEAQDVCKRICAAFCVGITFDDEYKNFGYDYNKCVCHTSIECAKFDTWNYDLLPFAVLHELGHMKDTSTNANTNTFAKELAAWKWAIDRYILIFLTTTLLVMTRLTSIGLKRRKDGFGVQLRSV